MKKANILKTAGFCIAWFGTQHTFAQFPYLTTRQLKASLRGETEKLIENQLKRANIPAHFSKMTVLEKRTGDLDNINQAVFAYETKQKDGRKVYTRIFYEFMRTGNKDSLDIDDFIGAYAIVTPKADAKPVYDEEEQEFFVSMDHVNLFDPDEPSETAAKTLIYYSAKHDALEIVASGIKKAEFYPLVANFSNDYDGESAKMIHLKRRL